MKTIRQTIVILAVLGVSACGGKQGSNYSPRYQAGSTTASLQTGLFVKNAIEKIEAKKEYAFLGETLVTVIKPSHYSSGNHSYVRALKDLSSQQILEAGATLFEGKGSVDTLDLHLTGTDIESKKLTTLNLLSAIERLREDEVRTGPEKARVVFEERLREWAPDLVAVAQQIYQYADSDEFRAKFDLLVTTHLNPSKSRSLAPDATIYELASGLDDGSRVTGQIRESLLKIDFESRISIPESVGNVVNRIKNLSDRDIFEAKRKIRDLIGSPALSEKDKKEKCAAEFRKIDAAIGLAGLVIDKVFEKPQTALRFVSTASNVVKVTKTVMNFKFGEVGAQIATGNFVAAASNIVSGLSDVMGIGGPDLAEERHREIMEALGSVRQDIAEFRSEMNARFDIVDKRLVEVTEKLDRQLEILAKADVKLDVIREEIRGLSKEVRGLQFLTEQGFMDLLDQRFNTDFNRCLGPTSLAVSNRSEVSAERISDCLTAFYQRAVIDSKLPTRAGDGIRIESTEERLHAMIEGGSKLQFSILSRILVAERIFDRKLDIANMVDWVSGTESFLKMSVLFPKRTLAITSRADAFRQILHEGKALREALKEAGNVHVIGAVLKAYEETLSLALRGSANARSLADTVNLYRGLLESLMQLTRPEQRFTDLSVVRALGGGSESLMTGDEVKAIYVGENVDSAMAERAKRRSVYAINSMKSFLDDQTRSGEDYPVGTVVDDTLRRLQLYMASQGIGE